MSNFSLFFYFNAVIGKALEIGDPRIGDPRIGDPDHDPLFSGSGSDRAHLDRDLDRGYH